MQEVPWLNCRLAQRQPSSEFRLSRAGVKNLRTWGFKRELNSWKMALVEAGALFALAYVATLIVYQLGSVFEIGTKMLQ
jgi:hypothetical protein